MVLTFFLYGVDSNETAMFGNAKFLGVYIDPIYT